MNPQLATLVTETLVRNRNQDWLNILTTIIGTIAGYSIALLSIHILGFDITGL